MKRGLDRTVIAATEGHIVSIAVYDVMMRSTGSTLWSVAGRYLTRTDAEKAFALACEYDNAALLVRVFVEPIASHGLAGRKGEEASTPAGAEE